MKKYEIEALLKSFFIFFFLQLVLLSVIYLQNIKQEIRNIDDKILSQMQICSFDFKCGEFEWDFLPKTNKTVTYKLYKDKDIYSFFDIPTINDYVLKVMLKKNIYKARIKKLKKVLIKKYLLYALLIAILSFLFSLYALRPLKMALKLNDEFIKDILHDINTPLSSIVINMKILKKKFGESANIDRIQSSINTILALQNNLKTFLENSKLQKEKVELSSFLSQRVEYIKVMYPDVKFKVKVDDINVFINKDSFIRVIDNILTNACKYSKENPKIDIFFKNDFLYIKDNGIGIKNPKKIYDRFYKENQRGVGIGMHIVKKLCDEMGIDIDISSEVDKGTTVILNLTKVILK